MVLYVHPVVRRKPGDPLLYLFPVQADGWNGHGLAFQSVADIERAGFVVGPWQADQFGDHASARRPG